MQTTFDFFFFEEKQTRILKYCLAKISLFEIRILLGATPRIPTPRIQNAPPHDDRPQPIFRVCKVMDHGFLKSLNLRLAKLSCLLCQKFARWYGTYEISAIKIPLSKVSSLNFCISLVQNKISVF
jgi:hypothetical protein